MWRLFAAPTAPFFELNFALHLFLIFAGPIVDPFAFRARQFDKSIL